MNGQNTSGGKLDDIAQAFVAQIAGEGTPELARRVEELLQEYGTSDDGTLIWALQQAQNEADREEIRAAALAGNFRCNSE